MNSPLIWYGGKGILKSKILPFINARGHNVYVEPFGGGVSILFAKKVSLYEVYNDIDHSLFEFFSVLSDPKLFELFYHKVSVLSVSRELYYNSRIKCSEESIIDRVSKWFVLVRQGFGGLGVNGSGWSYYVINSGKKTWLNCLKKLPEIHARLQGVQIDCQDWSKIFDVYDGVNTLFYCDPSYVLSTRISGKCYHHEMSDEGHKEFVAKLLTVKGQVVVSGYENSIYDCLVQNGWEKYEIETVTMFSGRSKCKEIVWATPLCKYKSKVFF